MILRPLLQNLVSVYQRSGPRARYSIEAFVLRNATIDRMGQARPPSVARCQPRMCFRNAAHLVIDRDDLIYVEGFYARHSFPIPMLHAWAIDEAGNIIDPTADDPCQYHYLGVQFDRTVLRRQLLKNGTYGLLDIGGPNIDLMQQYEREATTEACK